MVIPPIEHHNVTSVSMIGETPTPEPLIVSLQRVNGPDVAATGLQRVNGTDVAATGQPPKG